MHGNLLHIKINSGAGTAIYVKDYLVVGILITFLVFSSVPVLYITQIRVQYPTIVSWHEHEAI